MSPLGDLKISNRAVRDNNPGDLEASNLALPTKDGPYSVFATPRIGWQALYRQIGLYRDRGLTLAQMVQIYAPPNENRTAAYLAGVESRTGLTGNQKLSDVIPKFDPNSPPLPSGLPGVGDAAAVLPNLVDRKSVV